jgi:hypothetical protein
VRPEIEMKTKIVLGMIVTTLFAASMAACVGSTPPESGDETSASPSGEDGKEATGEATEADTYCDCAVLCAPPYETWHLRGAHHCGWTEADDYCGSLDVEAYGYACY